MRNEQLQNWALLAEVVSAIAVLVTLVFLISGMRENTSAIQSQTFQELMRDVNDWRSSVRDVERSGLLTATLSEDNFEILETGDKLYLRLIFPEKK